MARTVVVDVRKAVVAGIDAALTAAGASFNGVSCAYGYSAGDDERRELIYTARPRATHEPAAMKAGRNFRNEDMEFDVVVMVRSPKDSPEDNDERAADIGLLVEQFVADNKGNELGVTGLMWLLVSDLQIENFNTATGSMSLWQYTLHYKARLT